MEEAVIKNPKEKNQLIEILWKHRGVFRKQPGRLLSYEHKLRVRESQTFVGRSYPIPMAYREKVEKEIQRMLNMGIIKRSDSNYINPIVPVIKKAQ